MRFKAIYVMTPAQYQAGGIESLYQLIDGINRLGGKAIPIFDRHCSNPVLNIYAHYKFSEYGFSVPDEAESLLIVPEVWTAMLPSFKSISRAIWWLSVDNNHSKFQDFHDTSITHFCQSRYAYDYVTRNGAKNVHMLNDYIFGANTIQDIPLSEKQDFVCYNPAKGYEVTMQIMTENPNIDFRPISGLNREQVIDLLCKSKIYIDFGNHPGKDRIPREALLFGNCVITNRKGSAAFSEDVTVPDMYKLGDHRMIGEVIRRCLTSYETIIDEFANSKNILKHQCSDLDMQIKEYLL